VGLFFKVITLSKSMHESQSSAVNENSGVFASKSLLPQEQKPFPEFSSDLSY